MKDLSIFKDETLNKEFLKYGYVKLQLFNNEDCAKIKKEVKSIIKEESNTNFDFMTVPNISTSNEKSQKVNSFFKKIAEKRIYELLNNDYHFFSSTLFFKKRRSNKLIWHRDPTFYNMGKNNTPIAIWTGIDKTTRRNGCFRLVPKSHKLSFNYEAFPFKPLGMTTNSINLEEAYGQLINKYAIDIPLRKGEVIIHHHSLLHASHPNNSFFKKRIAYKITLFHKKIKSYEVAYFHIEKNKLEIFKTNKEIIENNLAFFDDYNKIKELIKNKQISLVKEAELDQTNIPFKSLKEMEEIMDMPGTSLRAKFEIC
ncbi:MAG: hypothetical protein COA67_00655 [Lutibacter sp.]|nr:MAG: hypothetical protein COA67_00655 [Lutibacter sp.]